MSGDEVADVLAAICLITGSALSLAAAIGIVRFPDLLTRLHAASKPQALGLLLVIIGLGLRLRTGIDATSLLLVGVFQLLTVPVGAHMVGRAAYRNRQVHRELLVVDELTERLEEARAEAAERDPGPPPGA
ncbi:MAG: monovalent cation/H(+) antiporter subunit G [Solirubrobacteraceae bacterium]|nr:monovalent cation/H(+) antiporter subunit G [Solirubrobacteraceae bacterium]